MFDSHDDDLWEVPSIDVSAPVEAAVPAVEAVPAPGGRGRRACSGAGGGRCAR